MQNNIQLQVLQNAPLHEQSATELPPYSTCTPHTHRSKHARTIIR